MLKINPIAKCGLILHHKCGTASFGHALNDDWMNVDALTGEMLGWAWAHVVRNPFARLVAVWGSHTPDNTPPAWPDFVEWALSNPTNPHIEPQSARIIVADPVLVRLESLDEGLNQMRAAGFPIGPVHHLNASTTPQDYRAVIDGGPRKDEILAFYQGDCTVYGYGY